MKLVLGTAQLGMDYGIVNNTAIPTIREVKAILDLAENSGVVWIDTARSYGKSEEMIGHALADNRDSRLKVITKLGMLESLTPDSGNDQVVAAVNSSVAESCRSLKRKSLDAVLLHRAFHLYACEGKIWEGLLTLCDEGIIAKLGVSVQNPDELIAALDLESISIIQLPYNLLDWRWKKAVERIQRVKCARDLTIHVRSCFLQGLLLTAEQRHWRVAGIDDCKAISEWLKVITFEYGRENILDLCLAYARSQPWVDGVVVGIDNITQLKMNLESISYPELSAAAISEIESSRPKLKISTLDPAQWASQ